MHLLSNPVVRTTSRTTTRARRRTFRNVYWTRRSQSLCKTFGAWAGHGWCQGGFVMGTFEGIFMKDIMIRLWWTMRNITRVKSPGYTRDRCQSLQTLMGWVYFVVCSHAWRNGQYMSILLYILAPS